MCKYCDNTTQLFNQLFRVDNSVIDHGNLTGIITNLRMDIRPEDNLYQLDIQLTEYDNKGNKSSDWSDNAIDINYCPFCGRSLRGNKEGIDYFDKKSVVYKEYFNKGIEYLNKAFIEVNKDEPYEVLCRKIQMILKKVHGINVDVESILNFYIIMQRDLKKYETSILDPSYVDNLLKYKPYLSGGSWVCGNFNKTNEDDDGMK